MMRRLTGVLVVMTLAGPAMLSGQAGDPTKVLADMRAALGGSDRLAAVRTLTAEGTTRRVTPRGTVERTTELALELPDKYVVRTQLTDQGNMSIYRSIGFNGDGLIVDTEAPPNMAMAGRDRVRGSDRMVAPTPEAEAATAARQLTTAKRDFARMALAMFGTSYEGFPLQFSYAGLAESPDGSAHVIGAQGAGGFEARLFVSVETNLPLMMMWSDPRPPNRRNPAEDAPTMIERRIYYSNFKAVDDINLPHTLRRSVDGNVTEEVTFEEITINPAIDSKTFEISK